MKKGRHNFYIPAGDMLDELREAARVDHRNLSEQVRFIIDHWLTDRRATQAESNE